MLWNLLYVRLDEDGKKSVILSDGAGYYAYLPAYFIYDDLQFEFTRPNNKKRPDSEGARDYFFMNQTPEGTQINKYFVGTAVAQLPFFLGALLVANLFDYPVDGYSFPFQCSVAIAALFWGLLGLVRLRHLLKNMGFRDYHVAITLLLLFLGTNLYHYTLNEPAMSHVYSFAFISMFLYRMQRALNMRLSKDLVFAGILFGMIVLIRPVNALIVLFIPALVSTSSTFISSIVHFFKRPSILIMAIVIGSAPLLLQSYMWYLMVDSWIADGYVGEKFDFKNPHYIDFLISWRKGWWIYTPMMPLALIGFISLRPKFRTITAITFIATLVYIASSWSSWTYGGSFGSRPLVDHYGALAIGLAGFIQFTGRWKVISITTSILVVFLTFLNLVQTYQFHVGILPYEQMTKTKYEKIFLKTHRIYHNIYPPDSEKFRSLPEGAVKLNEYIRTFEEDSSTRYHTWFSVEKNLPRTSGNFSTHIDDSTKATANLWAWFYEGTNDSTLNGNYWVTAEAKVYLTTARSDAYLALAFKDNAIVIDWQAEPLLWHCDGLHRWHTVKIARKIPMPKTDLGEAVMLVIHHGPGDVYADDFKLTFWKAPPQKNAK
jgi:hypothetical protein